MRYILWNVYCNNFLQTVTDAIKNNKPNGIATNDATINRLQKI